MERPTSALIVREPFSTLFPIEGAVLEAITENMREYGFDRGEPIDTWRDIVLDGHTRLQAAQTAGLEVVPVYPRQFTDEREALEFAIRKQRDRRNLTREQQAGCIARAIAALDAAQARGGDRRSEEFKASTDALNGGKTAVRTAQAVGTSPATVERVRVVLEQPDNDPVKAQLLNGEVTVREAARQVKARETPAPAAAGPSASAPSLYSVATWNAMGAEQRAAIIRQARSSPATFNKQDTDRIEWAQWSWNPVTGCDHGCPYCYARDIANRFYTELPEAERFSPVFRPHRLSAPRNTKVPRGAAQDIGLQNVFVCSMADLFGQWVPQDWIDAVFTEVEAASQWHFLFLTKFPQRLASQEWPANAWVGTSVDRQARVATAQRAFSGVRGGIKWLSCEPLLERLTFDSLAMFDWVVLGGQSRSAHEPEFQPPWEWVEHLIQQAREAGCQVYMKPNLTSRPREYPGQVDG